MPSAVSVLPTVPHYVHAQPTNADLDYADIPIIDLSKYDLPGSRAALAEQARDGMRTHGFFYVIGHGYPENKTERIFDIANVPFDGVSAEDKQRLAGTMKQTGSYQGYKLRHYWHIDGGIQDQVEIYNINRDVTKRQHPTSLQPLLPEISSFAEHNHAILHKILRLLAVGLGLPEDTLVDTHGYDAVGDTYVRFMKYYPRPQEEEEKTKNVWLKGHTDFGSITILWSQPVAGLQILSPDGKWRWIKHIPNALVINAGDMLEFLSGGYYKATIHRVIQPPADQRGQPRLGVFYFGMPDDSVKLVPYAESPVLREAGVVRRFEDADAPTAEVWRKGRTAAYGQSTLVKGEEVGVEEEYINGVLVKHYN